MTQPDDDRPDEGNGEDTPLTTDPDQQDPELPEDPNTGEGGAG